MLSPEHTTYQVHQNIWGGTQASLDYCHNCEKKQNKKNN